MYKTTAVAAHITHISGNCFNAVHGECDIRDQCNQCIHPQHSEMTRIARNKSTNVNCV